ncbi:MAG: NAD(P)(+) transhydrogenase (Re/Si-specific) subunit beta, partial [Pseudomonadota bacterium]|nr:NAD(P)(+) transhydrogenase (Re/Si-specific) subunit beta [Pseudomonadota bacterium]
MSIELINLWYVAAAALFIFGLKQLGSPATAVRGNTLSAMGMFIAIAVTLLNKNLGPWAWIIGATLIGGIIGAVVAPTVEMTSMPEMVALFNGSGGVASLMVGWAALYNIDNSTFTNITILLSIIIGGMTFSGSI